ncbi:MAG: hypothetical protein WAT19_07680 [Ferruginibacter sp.]
MNPGYNRFDLFLKKAEEQMAVAAKETNPALWLLHNNGRTPFFMLEALAKLYSSLHNEKKFDKLKERFKAVEDALGAMDYYDFFCKEFTGMPLVPGQCKDYLQGMLREKTEKLNEILKEEGWIGEEANRILKIRKKLEDIDWLKEKKEMKAILEFYGDSIKEIIQFYAAAKNGFTELEAEVHEIRRKLRWLSIYPQALQGAIQLTDNGLADEKTVKYLTEEIIHSSYNKMPDAGGNTNLLLLEKKYFYALSWMINELGLQKDKGLGIYILAEALEQTEGLPHADALKKACEILLNDANALQHILDHSNEICKSYFEEGNLFKLISGLATSAS